MDHLPHPKRPFEPLKIPYFDGPPYTPPFETFPARHGCASLSDKEPTVALTLEAGKLVQTAQSWAFFGMLQDFLDSAGVCSPLDDEGQTFLEDFLADEHGNCLQEPKALTEGWQDDDWLQYTESGRTQAPKGYWKGVVEKGEQPRRFITTKRLWWYLTSAIRRLRSMTASDREAAWKRLENRLYLSNRVAYLCNDFSLRPCANGHCHGDLRKLPDTEDKLLAVSLSIQALRQALIQARLIVDSRFGPREIVLNSSLLARRMTRQGWCPYQASWVGRSFTPVAAYYVALLGPCPMPLKDHVKCDDRQCHFLQIDAGEYEQEHQPGCDTACQVAEPDVDRVSAILEDGGIPLISIRRHRGDSVSRLEWNVDRWTAGSKFYAISHVWSDGMGNPQRSSLPLCQLAALATTAIAARSAEEEGSLGEEVCEAGATVSIWIDTLCVPLAPGPRRLAIARMKKTYSVAARVLVFDATLQRTRLEGASLLERCYRVLSCNWQRRLWTLQEAVFAPKLTFKFADGLLRYEELQSLMKPADAQGDTTHPADFATLEVKPALEYFCSGQYRAELTTSKDLQLLAATRLDRLIGAVRHCCHRTTSRMSDEAVCLASLLDADVEDVLDAPEPERFRRLLEHQRVLSAYIIFVHGPKIQQEPYRWAPATFMYPWNAMQRHFFTPMRSGKVGTVNRSGFLVDFPGIFVCAPSRGAMSGTDFFLRDIGTDGRRLLHMTTLPEDGSGSGGVQPVLTFQKDDSHTEAPVTGEDGGPVEMATYAVLMLGHFGVSMAGFKEVVPTKLPGLVVSNFKMSTQQINGQEKNVFQGRCEARVEVVEVDHNQHLLTRHGRPVQDEFGRIKDYDISHKSMRCFVVKEGSIKWCIR
ncbi:hypothetical protein CTRI78_v004592 [Colletotrichum trifolii]|uniref:Heterokaryon incompatibility domain-containing protein n=1 Tax=Colletotrichum trifolii TaxID=5466 RepID=A0A4V3HWS3_COLTR|nr:hypothetical protein CTRI78_v004592 [Colletotrichum trifolii]